MWCAAAKRKCALTKEGFKKSRRVFTKSAEGMGLKESEGRKKEVGRNGKGPRMKKRTSIRKTEIWKWRGVGGSLWQPG